MREFRGEIYRIGDIVEYSVKRGRNRGHIKWHKAIVVYDYVNRRYGLKLLMHKFCIAKFYSGILEIRKIQRVKLRKYKVLNMKDYDKNKFKHYIFNPDSGMPCIGCCCQCNYQKAVNSHPWHNGKPVSGICAYVCTYSEGDDNSFMLIGEHGIGCECFDGNEDWQRHMNKIELLRKLKK